MTAMIGHSDVRTTKSIYVHLFARRGRSIQRLTAGQSGRSALRRAETTAEAEVHELEAARERRRSRGDPARRRARASRSARRGDPGELTPLVRSARRWARRCVNPRNSWLESASERRPAHGGRGSGGGGRAARGRAAAREALHTRIQSEIASSVALARSRRARCSSSTNSRPSSSGARPSCARDMDALQRELAPAETELQSAEQRRAELVAERQAVEQRLAVLRAAERARARDARSAPRHRSARARRARTAEHRDRRDCGARSRDCRRRRPGPSSCVSQLDEHRPRAAARPSTSTPRGGASPPCSASCAQSAAWPNRSSTSTAR